MQASVMSGPVQTVESPLIAWNAPGVSPTPVSQTVSQGVRRAEALIAAHPDTPFTVDGLARAVGVSTRSLSRGFQRLRGYGPMAAVRRARLERVRLDLLTADPHDSVTNAAMRWGFFHLGRFSSLYALAFRRAAVGDEAQRRALASQPLKDPV